MVPIAGSVARREAVRGDITSKFPAAAARSSIPPEFRYADYGFRVACSLGESNVSARLCSRKTNSNHRRRHRPGQGDGPRFLGSAPTCIFADGEPTFLRSLIRALKHRQACSLPARATSEAACRGHHRSKPYGKRGSLDGLVNNAAGNFLARTQNLSVGAFEAVLGIVLMGTIHTTLACGKRWFSRRAQGPVLNISATYAPTGSATSSRPQQPKPEWKPFMRSLAVEWGQSRYSHERHCARPDTHRGCTSHVSLPRPELEDVAKKRIPAESLWERSTNSQISQRS